MEGASVPSLIRNYLLFRCCRCRLEYPDDHFTPSALRINSGPCRECERIRRRKHYLENKASVNNTRRQAYYRNKQLIFKHYGKQCTCCGESEFRFLTLDHINNNGTQHRKQNGIKGTGTPFYAWVVAHGFPPDLQTLCYNCNLGKKTNGGICPHKEKV